MLNGTYCGVGAGAGGGSLYNSSGSVNLFPQQVRKLRRVRLFKKTRESDKFWVEQAVYSKTRDPAEFCGALSKAVPYTSSTIAGQCASPYYGARAQHILDQYSKHVPPRFVPDKYAIRVSGLSGRLNEHTQQLLTGAGAEQQLEEVIIETRNYDKSVDDVNLLALCAVNAAGVPIMPKAKDHAKVATDLDPLLKVSAVKRALGRLCKEGLITRG